VSLADIAIDSDTAVIEDPEDERFYVVHDGYRYVYVPPGTDGTAPRVTTTGAPTADATRRATARRRRATPLSRP
jgi:hypothetical protein